MALSDFTFVTATADGPPVATLSGTSPIEGVQSGLIQMVPNASNQWILYYTAGCTAECVDVKVLLRQNTSRWQSMGICAKAQSAGVGMSAYYAVLHDASFSTTGRLTINKGNLNGACTDTSGLAFADVPIPAATGVVALGLRCERDAASGNMYMTASYDPGPITIPVLSSYDFPGLTSQCTYLDAVSPYVTGVTLGLVGAISGPTVNMDFDVFVVDTD